MKTIYDVTVTFDPASVAFPVESAAIRGEFLFYHSNMTGNTDETGMVENDPKYPPSAYEDGMDPIGGLYFEEMTITRHKQIFLLILIQVDESDTCKILSFLKVGEMEHLSRLNAQSYTEI